MLPYQSSGSARRPGVSSHPKQRLSDGAYSNSAAIGAKAPIVNLPQPRTLPQPDKSPAPRGANVAEFGEETSQAAGGGPCSNTAPTIPKRNRVKPRIISAQVDWHAGSIRNQTLPLEVRDYLLDLLASNGDKPVETCFSTDDEPLYVRWAGQGKLCLHNDLIDWREVNAGETAATVTIYSPAEWKHGPHAALQMLQAFVNELYGCPVTLYRGRVDFAVDLVGFPMAQFNVKPTRLRDMFITRATEFKPILNGGEIGTLYVGSSGGEKRLRIYNKTLELTVKPKTHYQPVWDAAEYDSEREGDITRVEFQTNPQWWAHFLPSDAMPAITMHDQLGLLGHAWGKLTQEVRMVVPNAQERHRERLATTLLWQLVQSPFNPATPHATGSMYRRRHPQREAQVRQMAGNALSVLAQTAGAEYATFDDCWHVLGSEVARLWSPRGEFEQLVTERRARLMAS